MNTTTTKRHPVKHQVDTDQALLLASLVIDFELESDPAPEWEVDLRLAKAELDRLRSWLKSHSVSSGPIRELAA